MLYYVFIALYVLVCFLLLVVVLLQQGKGGDIAAAFGGASSQTAFGARAGATFLTRATTILGTLFMLGALGLTIMGGGGTGSGSVIGAVDAPKSTTPAAPALPTAPVTTPAPTPEATPPATQKKSGADTKKAPAKKGGGGL
jgi:preprotein translocase subunit SecG